MHEKKYLILCTGNSCRSIIAEALLNYDLSYCVNAYSAGVAASGKVNPNAEKILKQNNMWSENYHSKAIETILGVKFDLVVTVCGNAQETCPTFPGKTEVIHIGFDDPDGQAFDVFKQTFMQIREKLVPVVSDKLCLS
ncbi:arsenate reductase ArsC [Bathymodiolus septemdierum thioautotrophic gill symbiont]|uniref:arsenate reductase ArsC n=1 Tax=Bathymodiolus septemdierum thioautotrophic gill symbiont TaxID=113267 RepID=UPI0008254E50|nr:arsenate reductase ArsC [Bathymodiolus septemdierum thioautotrophic gill symbiont]